MRLLELLKFTIKDVPLYDNATLTVDFTNQQRVSQNEINHEVAHLFNRVYKKKIFSLVGINATGKTTTLNFIVFILNFYLQEMKIGDKSIQNLIDLLGEHPQVTAYFYDSSEQRVIRIVTDFERRGKVLKIKEEKISYKKITSNTNKNNLYSFTDENTFESFSRSSLGYEVHRFLSDEVSIMIAYAKDSTVVSDRLQYTNANILTLFDKEITEFPEEVIQFLDPSIEYLKKKNDGEDLAKTSFELKFYGKDPNHLTFMQLEQQISSGTIKGINVFTDTIRVLKSGGYMIIDEIENHLNKSIVISLIDLFKSPLNEKNAVLVFSTHYTEVIDTLDRRDLIHVTQKNGEQISVTNLSAKEIRDEVKLSSLYLNSKIEGLNTAPKYNSYIRLKRKIKKEIQND